MHDIKVKEEDNAIEEDSVGSRAFSEELDAILGKSFPILDHGFIRVVDYMGNDSSVVQAARVSYGTGTKSTRQDRGLIRYLMRHHHTTPFEMCDIKLHLKMPIFVARQWLRHRTASVNEYSARYSILDEEFYLPEEDKISLQSSQNMQGREDVSMKASQEVRDILERDMKMVYKDYRRMLDMGVSREIARANVNLGIYTQMYWKINLHNLLHFLRLRADSHAQYEIRVYAECILNEIVSRWVPYVYEAYVDYRGTANNMSGLEMKLLKRMLKGEDVNQENSGLSKREWDEFMEVLQD